MYDLVGPIPCSISMSFSYSLNCICNLSIIGSQSYLHEVIGHLVDPSVYFCRFSLIALGWFYL